ncbi:MAG: hypothetical protein GF317_19990 [Candidatus Lokiarchaeota archaeon]|nr:hypothetical protein [Candidatus Lokiarchaeota archaeon]MBD3201775.1 hypothetical protein [Candidatus Lokiarchaeota archaeon]
MLSREELFDKIVHFLKHEGASKVSIFGSYARGQEKPESDIDVLVEFSQTKTLLEFVKIERELSEYIGVKVDLVTEKSLSPHIKEYMEKELREVYG